jgi:peptide/nickel transport system substrate-binding protein
MIYPQPQLDLVQQVKALPDVTSQSNLGPTFEHLDFNFKNQFLGDIAVRKAIATGINVDELVKRTVGQFSDKVKPLGNRIWMPFQKPYQDHFTGQYGKGDVAGAQKLLDDAGYTKGSDGIYAKGGKKISLRFSTTAGNKLRETQGELFQAQMKQVGIDIKIANLDSQKLFGDALPNGNFDISDFAWVGGPFVVSGFRDTYRTGGGSNWGNYSNPKVDQLFEQASGEFDQNKQADLMNQADQVITDDMATIPLYNKPTFLGIRNTFANVNDNATSDGPFWDSYKFAQKAQ